VKMPANTHHPKNTRFLSIEVPSTTSSILFTADLSGFTRKYSQICPHGITIRKTLSVKDQSNESGFLGLF
jgi:hypothetical protein